LIIVLVRQPEDLVRAPLAQLLGEGVGAFLLLRLLPSGLARVRARLDPGAIRPLLARSWPIVGHSLLGLAIFNSDFLFLRAFRDSAAVGLYAAAYTLISFFLNLGAAYTMTLLPVITRLRDDPAEAKVLYDGSMAQVMTGALPVAIGGFLVAGGVIDLVFTPAYHASTLPLQVLLWTIPVALIRNVSQSALIGYGRQDQLLHTVAWAAAVNVVLNLALIPRWGMLGAAIATLATEVVRTMLAVRYAWRLGLPMTSPRRFVRIALAALTMGLAVWLAGALPVLATIAIGALTYGVALTVLGVLRFRRGALPELAA
jgi:O-antigen/teichoic acid export membrane protein